MPKFKTWWFTGLISISAIFSSACTTTQIVEQHELFVPATQEHATIYFMRPTLQRTRGVADNDLSIDLDKKLALTLSIGEYAAILVKPKIINITFRNLSYLTSDVMPKEVTRSKLFTFEVNKTYFILADFQQEEFRGIYFKPIVLDQEKALSLIKSLRPAGNIARNNTDRLM